eukprot:TRINITY_DN1749_c0_g1_i5.p2 TRINITY_DN1749_c0_g1~~TRINITY_DN1749_c0_g1_i5.p2  ORF type:complete len:237 (-),score=75.38 TRINITY_DN1749_c0_g1_i5:128-838(-)
MPAVSSSDKVLSYEKVAESVKRAQYAVRGEIYLAASERIKKGEKVIFTNVGNPHGLGQKPLTFPRQVMALLTAPFLLDDPRTATMFPADAITRAKTYLANIKGGVGAYSDSVGNPYIRDEVAQFIQTRDGHAADPERIFLTNGASEAVRTLLRTLIRGHMDGVMVPVPQYPLYSAMEALYRGYWGTGTMTPSMWPRMRVRSSVRTASDAPFVRKMRSGSAAWPSRVCMNCATSSLM